MRDVNRNTTNSLMDTANHGGTGHNTATNTIGTVFTAYTDKPVSVRRPTSDNLTTRRVVGQLVTVE